MTTDYVFDPSPIQLEPRLWSLYLHCRERGSGGLPAWSDMRGRDLARWRRNLMLVRFHGSVTAYEIEWEGASLQQYYGSDRAGRGLETLTAARERDLLIDQYGSVMATRRPAYFESAFTNSDGVFARQTKMLLPFSDDGKRIDCILVGIYFRGMNNVVDILGKLNDLAANLAFPTDLPARVTRRLAAVTARRERLSQSLRRAEREAAGMGLTQAAARIRTAAFIIADMALLEGRMMEAGWSWPSQETADDLVSLFDFGLADVVATAITDLKDRASVAGLPDVLDAYRDALLNAA